MTLPTYNPVGFVFNNCFPTIAKEEEKMRDPSSPAKKWGEKELDEHDEEASKEAKEFLEKWYKKFVSDCEDNIGSGKAFDEFELSMWELLLNEVNDYFKPRK